MTESCFERGPQTTEIHNQIIKKNSLHVASVLTNNAVVSQLVTKQGPMLKCQSVRIRTTSTPGTLWIAFFPSDVTR